jgi:23S rRNA (adenine2503-C2)-methyltransferase
VTFEYVMLKASTTAGRGARSGEAAEGRAGKINLIPFNPWPGTKYECSDWETIEAFAEVLNRAAMPRRSARRAAAISSPPAASSAPRA